jgi:hypothetical protein
LTIVHASSEFTWCPKSLELQKISFQSPAVYRNPATTASLPIARECRHRYGGGIGESHYVALDRAARVAVVTLLGGTAAARPLSTRAQQSAKPPIIGYLGPTSASTESECTAAFVRRLHELGWIEQNRLWGVYPDEKIK